MGIIEYIDILSRIKMFIHEFSRCCWSSSSRGVMLIHKESCKKTIQRTTPCENTYNESKGDFASQMTLLIMAPPWLNQAL